LSQLNILSDKENKLLSRREIVCKFRVGSGLLTRQGAAEAISSRLGVEKGNVQIISMKGKSGQRALVADAYVFPSSQISAKQIPKHLIVRMFSKDERKKIREDMKKAKTSAPVVDKGGQKTEQSKPS